VQHRVRGQVLIVDQELHDLLECGQFQVFGGIRVRLTIQPSPRCPTFASALWG
jgi:hypothetical protein